MVHKGWKTERDFLFWVCSSYTPFCFAYSWVLKGLRGSHVFVGGSPTCMGKMEGAFPHNCLAGISRMWGWGFDPFQYWEGLQLRFISSVLWAGHKGSGKLGCGYWWLLQSQLSSVADPGSCYPTFAVSWWDPYQHAQSFLWVSGSLLWWSHWSAKLGFQKRPELCSPFLGPPPWDSRYFAVPLTWVWLRTLTLVLEWQNQHSLWFCLSYLSGFQSSSCPMCSKHSYWSHFIQLLIFFNACLFINPLACINLSCKVHHLHWITQ